MKLRLIRENPEPNPYHGRQILFSEDEIDDLGYEDLPDDDNFQEELTLQTDFIVRRPEGAYVVRLYTDTQGEPFETIQPDRGPEIPATASQFRPLFLKLWPQLLAMIDGNHETFEEKVYALWSTLG